MTDVFASSQCALTLWVAERGFGRVVFFPFLRCFCSILGHNSSVITLWKSFSTLRIFDVCFATSCNVFATSSCFAFAGRPW